MKFKIVTDYPAEAAAIIPVAENSGLTSDDAQELDKRYNGLISAELKRRNFTGKHGEVFVMQLSDKPMRRAIVLGIGGPPWNGDHFRRGAAVVVKTARAHHLTALAGGVSGPGLSTAVPCSVEGALLGDYQFATYQKQEERRPELTYFLVAKSAERAAVERLLAASRCRAAAAMLARDLVNEPPSRMTPTDLAKAAQQIAKKAGLACEVWDQAKITKTGMEAFLAVAKGSDQPPKLIRLEYVPTGANSADRKNSQKHVVLVGKGITFDSGGLNLKPSRGGSLEDMKMDMAGGAAVIGAMSALKELAVTHKVTGYVAATENLLGGSAYKPGDVVRAYNGKTIEVLNTDAEGRLTLADVLSYAEKNDQPNVIIDLATLTVTEVSLGLDYAAGFGDETLLAELQAAGEATGEKIWPFPLPDDYQETVKGRIADLRNTGTDRGYSINGAVFLRNFVSKDTPWSHLDIGSPASSEKDRGYLQPGGTGFGVRLLLEYLSQ